MWKATNSNEYASNMNEDDITGTTQTIKECSNYFFKKNAEVVMKATQTSESSNARRSQTLDGTRFWHFFVPT